MVFGKSCAFYKDSRCIYKGKPCDLACTQMGYDEEEYAELPEALPQAEKRVFFYFKSGHQQVE